MSEPWTCPNCAFEWVVPVGGECLSCGYSMTDAHEDTQPGPQSFDRTGEQAPRLSVFEDMTALYPAGTYPPPVETSAVVNGPLAGSGGAEPERQTIQAAQVQQMQATFRKVMETARQRILALEQEVAAAAAAESEVRASLEQWQQAHARQAQETHRLAERERVLQAQAVQLAEANQQLRQEQAQWRASVNETPSRTIHPTPQRPPATSFQAEARRVDRLEQRQQELTQQMGQLSALLDTIMHRLDRTPVPTDAVSEPEDAYATWITTDTHAARVEEEILRNQAQYNRPWRG